MPGLSSYLLVGVGSALGGMARYWCTGLVAARWGNAFPWGTLAVNVVGSFLIGVLATGLVPGGRWLLPVPARDLLMVGVLGGYTTFSAFSLQTLNLLEQGDWARAGWNVVLSVALCLGAVAAGYLLGITAARPG
jgi:fluoride exporter